MPADLLYQKLKEILLEEERRDQKRLRDRISIVDEKIEKREKLAPHIQPIFDDKVTYLQQNFSFLFRPQVPHSIKKQILTMLIWDIAGSTPHQKIPQSYMLGSHGVLFVIDLSRPSSYEDLLNEMAAIQEFLPDVPIQPVDNKIDLLAESSIQEVAGNLPPENVIYTSAKTGENVNLAFESLGEAILR